jgi:Zn-dependent M28 family amino/carboxypeptidase
VGVGQDGQVYNGADDNGTGTCGLLALAEALVFRGPLRRSVLLLWVSGEEKGLYGSQAWTASPWLPDGARPFANINLDMIGRNAPQQIHLTPSRAHSAYNGLSRLAERLAPEEGFTEISSADDYYTRSDHVNFARLGLPVTFLFADIHEDYHRPGDDPEKIDGDKVRRVVRLVLRILEAMQDDSLALGN